MVLGVQGISDSRNGIVDEDHLLHVAVRGQAVQVDRLFATRAAIAIPVDLGVDRLPYVIAVGQSVRAFGDDIRGKRSILDSRPQDPGAKFAGRPAGAGSIEAHASPPAASRRRALREGAGGQRDQGNHCHSHRSPLILPSLNPGNAQLARSRWNRA